MALPARKRLVLSTTLLASSNFQHLTDISFSYSRPHLTARPQAISSFVFSGIATSGITGEVVTVNNNGEICYNYNGIDSCPVLSRS